jgi:hypothetical protein
MAFVTAVKTSNLTTLYPFTQHAFAKVRKASGTIPGNHFSIPVSALVAFDFLSARISLSFQHTGKKWAVTCPGNTAGAS